MPSVQHRIFVTGGRGRLASLIADYFSPPAHEISLFSRKDGPGFQSLSSLLQSEVISHADAVLHLAWSSLPATSEQQPGIEHAQDLPYLEKLLHAMAAAPGSEQKQFIFFSSGGAVYGNAPGRPNIESDVCRPVGRYACAKHEAETMIESFAAQHGLRCAILRISNPYGYPVPKSRVQGLIPHALRCATEGDALTLWGDGSAQKDFLYYTDFLAGLKAVISHRLAGVYNLSSGQSHRVREVLSMVEAQSGSKIAVRTAPAPAWDVRDSRLSPARLSAATGWKPQVSLEEGIRRAAAGYAAR